MRIIGGSLGGRRIEAPPGSLVRPTSDRVREAIFNILGPPGPGARVLDAFAGAGSLGLEALSRGADGAVFIDSARASIRCLERNIQALAGLAGRARVRCADTPALLRRWRDSPAREQAFDWVFIDPPYKGDLAATVLEILGDGALLAPDAVVIVEHDRRNPPGQRYGSLSRSDQRRYGDTCVSFYSLRAPDPPLDP